MSQQELNEILDDEYLSYMESGSYYDTDREEFSERFISDIEQTYNLSVVEC